MTERTSTILNRAADLIEGEGWWSSTQNGSGACASNSISRVSRTAGVSAAAMLEAQWALAEHVSGRRNVTAIWVWNDAPQRTQGEVIEAMRAAAVIAEAREEQDAAYATYSENLALVAS